MDARLAALLDKQEIKEVILRYCRGIDRRDFEIVRACYHPDATDEHGSFSGTVDEYLEWVDRLLARYQRTMHLVGNVLIDLRGDRAAAETYGVSVHRGIDDKPHLNLATGFRFLDVFERRDGAWRIAERVAVSEWSVEIPAQSWWDIPDHLRQGTRDGSDALYGLLARLSSNSSHTTEK